MFNVCVCVCVGVGGWVGRGGIRGVARNFRKRGQSIISNGPCANHAAKFCLPEATPTNQRLIVDFEHDCE